MRGRHTEDERVVDEAEVFDPVRDEVERLEEVVDRPRHRATCAFGERLVPEERRDVHDVVAERLEPGREHIEEVAVVGHGARGYRGGDSVVHLSTRSAFSAKIFRTRAAVHPRARRARARAGKRAGLSRPLGGLIPPSKSEPIAT